MIRKTLFVWFLLAISGAGAMGHSEPELGSKAWVEAQIERAKSFEVPEGIRVRWREETHRLMTDAELGETRRRIAGKPDHPDRFAVMGEEQRIAEGPDIREYELLYQDANQWRYNCTTLGARPGYADMAFDRSRVWQLTPEQGQYIDGTSPPRGFEPESRQGQFTSALRSLILGPFSIAGRSEYEVLSTGDNADGTWRCRIRRDDIQYEWVLTGKRLSDRIVISERQAFAEVSGKWFDRGFTAYSDRKMDGFRGPTVWNNAVSYLPDGTVSRSIHLVSVETLDRDELRAALRPPAAGGRDSVRGAVTALQFVDYREGPPIVKDTLADGTVRTSSPAGSTAGRGDSAAAWRVAGWVSGIVLIAMTFVVWWHRRPSHG